MTLFENPSIRHYLGMLALAMAVLVGGTWLAVKTTTDHLLYQNATQTAQNWAQYLAANVGDLEQIASGETPSSASLAFFNATRKAGEVFRYTIFNRYGYSVLVSDRDRITSVDLSDYSAIAARSIKEGHPIVDAKEGGPPDQPAYFAEAYIPVMVDGRPAAIVAAYVDQTAEHGNFYRTFLIAAVSLCLLTGFAFGLPAVAWYRRTKEKERAERQIRYLAHHDAMTGLDNRYRLTEKLQRALVALPERGGKLALHYVDLDRFKDVNDTLGHDAGDGLIQAVAERLRMTARKKDIVARIGGDEFMIAQVEATDKGEAEALAERVLAALTQPFVIEGHSFAVTASVGIAMAPTDAIDMAQLMRRADLALYKAKADGRNCYRFFTAQLDIDYQARLELEKALRDAVAHEGFELYFQPVYDSATRSLVGFEALLRLPPHPDGRSLSPSVFIPVAEELGLIGDVTRWVLREACRNATTWPDQLTVAVNMSPAQFTTGDINEMVAAALQQSGLKPQRLEIEVTEGLLLSDTESVMNQLDKLKQLGVSIVMDDFGTGYSSLSYLWRFHFDKIKIDQSFMQAFENADRDAETIVKTIVALGRSLHMQVTVEGVETRPQAEFVRGLAADQVQGYYYGRPMPAAEIAGRILSDYQRSLAEPVALQQPPAASPEPQAPPAPLQQAG